MVVLMHSKGLRDPLLPERNGRGHRFSGQPKRKLRQYGGKTGKFQAFTGHHKETFEKCSILVKFKEGENFNRPA